MRRRRRHHRAGACARGSAPRAERRGARTRRQRDGRECARLRPSLLLGVGRRRLRSTPQPTRASAGWSSRTGPASRSTQGGTLIVARHAGRARDHGGRRRRAAAPCPDALREEGREARPDPHRGRARGLPRQARPAHRRAGGAGGAGAAADERSERAGRMGSPRARGRARGGARRVRCVSAPRRSSCAPGAHGRTLPATLWPRETGAHAARDADAAAGASQPAGATGRPS